MYLIATDIPDEVTDAIYASISKMCCKRKGLNILVDTDTMYILVVLKLCQQEKDAKKKESTSDSTSEEEYTKSKQVAPTNKIVKEKLQKRI